MPFEVSSDDIFESLETAYGSVSISYVSNSTPHLATRRGISSSGLPCTTYNLDPTDRRLIKEM